MRLLTYYFDIVLLITSSVQSVITLANNICELSKCFLFYHVVCVHTFKVMWAILLRMHATFISNN